MHSTLATTYLQRTAIALAVTLLAAPSWAQTAAPSTQTLPAEADNTDRDKLSPVVVTATRGSKAVDRIPGAVSVISRTELDEQLRVAEDLSAVLASQVPGYAPSTQKLTSAGESLRGRTALIERIEVISGPSAVQGLGATGGIINYISRTPRKEGTTHTLDAKLSTQGRSDDATVKLGYLLEHKRDTFDAVVYVGGVQRGVGVDGDGRRLGVETTQGDLQDSAGQDVFAKVGWRFAPDQRLGASFNQFRISGNGDWTQVSGNRATGLPTSAQKGGVVQGATPRNEVRTASVEWTHDALAGGSATVQVYKQDFRSLYGAGTFANFQDTRIAPSGTLVDQSDIVANKHGLRASWVRPDVAVRGLEFTGGLDWLSDTSKQRLALTGRDWVPPLEFQSIAPFAQLEYEAGPVTVRGGLRREHATLAVDTYTSLAAYGRRLVQGGERSFDEWVKNLGVVWRFAPGWSGFAAYSEGFGLPDVGLVLRAVNVEGRSPAPTRAPAA